LKNAADGKNEKSDNAERYSDFRIFFSYLCLRYEEGLKVELIREGFVAISTFLDFFSGISEGFRVNRIHVAIHVGFPTPKTLFKHKQQDLLTVGPACSLPPSIPRGLGL
jgi:hypothetical protein